MSSSESSTYPRENFFDHDADDYEDSPPQPQATQQYGVSKEEYRARSFLLGFGDPTLLCSRCWYEDNIRRELSDPELYVPPSVVQIDEDTQRKFYSDHRRHRFCWGECGHVAWGGKLENRETDEFLRIVGIVLDDIYDELARRDEYYRNAQSRKARGWDDEPNMRQLVQELEAANPDLDE